MAPTFNPMLQCKQGDVPKLVPSLSGKRCTFVAQQHQEIKDTRKLYHVITTLPSNRQSTPVFYKDRPPSFAGGNTAHYL